MTLLHLYDRETIEASLNLQLDAELHQLLAIRVAHLSAGDLLDMTEIVVVTGETLDVELTAALGFNPLCDLDGRRFGQAGFCTQIDYVARVSLVYHEAIVAVGNSGFAFQLLVREDADPELVALCREMAA